jgi:hypothetical protein
MILMKFSLILLLISLSHNAWSAIKVDSTNYNKKTLSVVFNKHLARFYGSKKGQYMLPNTRTRKKYDIDSRKRKILDISVSTTTSDNPVKKPVIKLINIGSGPVIAGYPTTQYEMTADGTLCETIFSSKIAAKQPAMKAYTKIMQAMANMAKSANVKSFTRPCFRAQRWSFEEYRKLGTLMKSVKPEGKITFLITKINTSFEVPKNYFNLPKNYKTDDMQQMLDSIRKRISAQKQR